MMLYRRFFLLSGIFLAIVTACRAPEKGGIESSLNQRAGINNDDSESGYTNIMACHATNGFNTPVTDRYSVDHLFQRKELPDGGFEYRVLWNYQSQSHGENTAVSDVVPCQIGSSTSGDYLLCEKERSDIRGRISIKLFSQHTVHLGTVHQGLYDNYWLTGEVVPIDLKLIVIPSLSYDIRNTVLDTFGFTDKGCINFIQQKLF